MGDAAAWSPGVARRPPKKGGTGDLRVRLKEDKWNGRLSLEGLPRYDAMRDPNCPRAMSAIFKGMEENKAAYQIKDWGLSHTSLEEVFLQIVNVHSLARSL